MSDKKEVKGCVAELIEELKKNPSSRFSKSDFQMLVYGVLSDKDFKAKKWLLKGGELIEEEAEFNGPMKKFLDKLLKHAGIAEASERAAVLESFEYSPKDVEWIVDVVDEAQYLYAECDKNLRVFRDKMLQLTVRKMTRGGAHAGEVTYKKSVTSRAIKNK